MKLFNRKPKIIKVDDLFTLAPAKAFIHFYTNYGSNPEFREQYNTHPRKSDLDNIIKNASALPEAIKFRSSKKEALKKPITKPLTYKIKLVFLFIKTIFIRIFNLFFQKQFIMVGKTYKVAFLSEKWYHFKKRLRADYELFKEKLR